MKRFVLLVLLAVLCAVAIVSTSAQAQTVKRDVPAGAVGSAQNGALIVAQRGSIVYARKGSNVQYWPGAKLVSVKNAATVPDCEKASVRADGTREELFAGNGAQACTIGDTAVIAQEGSTVIYDDDVPLIRRPVVRR